MALLWFDGFDHYGLDETKLTEGPYDQVDAAFTLSEVNPRTGARCLRRDSSAGDSLIRFDLGHGVEVIGVGLAINASQLPVNVDSYPIFSLLDSSLVEQTTLLVQPGGRLAVKAGGRNGAASITSEIGAFFIGGYIHIESAFMPGVQTGFTQEVKIEKQSSGWKWKRISISDDSDFSAADFDDSSWDTGKAPFIDQEYPYDPGDGFAQSPGTDVGVGTDARIWLRRDFTIGTENNTGFIDFYHDDEGDVWVNGILVVSNAPIGRTLAEVPNGVIVPGINTIAIRVTNTIQTGPQGGWVYADLEISVSGFSNSGGGFAEVRVNGVTEISNPDLVVTLDQGAEYRYLDLKLGSSEVHGVTTDIDDFFIWDDRGAWNNSFLGDRRALLRSPNADTNVSDFEPSSGDFGYRMIDEDSPDEDATFILAESALLPGSPPSGSSEFEIKNLPNGISHIAGISVFTRAAKTDSDGAEIFTSVISGVNSVSGSPHELLESYGYHVDLYEYDPATIANFTKGGFDLSLISVTADFAPGEGSPGEGSPGEGSPGEGSPGEGGDPFWASVHALAKMEDGDGSTTVADEASGIWAVSGSGSQVTTARAKFGTGSFLTNGSNAALRLTNPPSLGTSDFTIEFFAAPVQAHESFGRIFQTVNGDFATGLSMVVASTVKTANVDLYSSSDGSTNNVFNALRMITAPVSDQFYHFAFMRSSGTLYAFVDGVLISSAAYAASFVAGSEWVFGGQSVGTSRNAGWGPDEIRVTPGVARYNTAGFTPPSVEFPTSE